MRTKSSFQICLVFFVVILTSCSDTDSDPTGPSLSLPSAPGSLTVETLSSSSVSLNWSDNSTNEDGFQLEYGLDNSFNPFSGTILEENSTSLVVDGLSPSTEYFFRINAFNDDGDSGFSNVRNASTNALPTSAPNPPASLAIAVISDTELRATWSDESDDEENFLVQWSIEEDFSEIFSAQLAAGTESLIMSGLSSQVQYFVRVQAVNSSGQSSWSATESASTIESVSGDFSIDGGSEYTNTRSIILNVGMVGISQMAFSNDNSNWSQLTNYSSSHSWTLASGDGTKTVFARFYDSVGNVFERSDAILLDTTAPVVSSFAIDDGAGRTFSSSVTLNNDVMGAAQMRFRMDGYLWSSWIDFDLTKSYVIPENENASETVYAEFRDEHGNVSTANDAIVYDAIRTIKILPVSLAVDHASDGGSPGEMYWDFYGTNQETEENFGILSRGRDDYVTMEDGETILLLNMEFGLTSVNRGTLGNGIYIHFRLRENDSDGNDDSTGISTICLYESDDWYIGQYYNFTVGELDSGPLGTMRFICQFVD